jgi:hypothetical protein
VVDIGCGLDTCFDRLDDGQMAWLGVDLPEVIEPRREVLPDGDDDQRVAPKTQSGDVLYTVHIRMEEVDPLLRWGMTVEVMFSNPE